MLVGTIGSPRRAHLDGSGRLTIGRATPDEITIGWWIGAEDRWYVPDREVTVRQSMVQGSPVTMSAVRIPGGDATLTVFGSVQGPRELAVIEVADRGRAPIVWALTISGPGARRVSVDGSTLRVDGFALLTLPRAPMRSAAANDLAALEAIVTTGAATEGTSALKAAGGGDGADAVALLFPVSQGTSARAAALIGASSSLAMGASPVLAALPDVHTAASGWGVHVGRGPRINCPDRQRTEQVQAAVGALLLAAEPLIADLQTDVRTRAVMARALDGAGLHAEAGALLEGIDEFQRRNGLVDDEHYGKAPTEAAITSAHVVDALSRHAWLTRDRVFAETLAPTVAAALEGLLKAAKKSAELVPLLACLANADAIFDVGADPRAAAQVRSMWERGGRPWPLAAVALPVLPALSVGGSLVPDEPLRLAAFADGATGALASARPGGVVDLFPAFESTWRGASFDVRNVAVPGGRLSAAVRWHGARPAVLWEVVGECDVTVSATSIDPDWQVTGRGGDALLAAPVDR